MSLHSVAQRPLTLDDITVTRTVGSTTERWSGADLARIIDAIGDHEARDRFTDASSIACDLVAIGELLGVLVGAEQDLTLAAGYLQNALEGLARRVAALQPCGNREPGWYGVEVHP